MMYEINLLTAITRRLPPVKGAGWLANKIKDFYNRKSRSVMSAEVHGFDMQLNPAECVDGALLFYPHLYDRKEIDFLKKNLHVGDVFIDAGANIGIYSLVASGIVGPSGRVISIEADPYSAEKLRRNVARNGIDNIQVEQFGLSNKKETLTLHQQVSGNRGGSTFLGSGNGVPVTCFPLIDFIDPDNVGQIAALKIDIEGLEEKVLRAFFESANQGLYPRFIIAEFNPGYCAADKLAALFIENGYSLAQVAGINYIWIMR